MWQDYKPYPKDSDVCAGDYPDLPLVPQEEKNALYDWDFPEYRRYVGAGQMLFKSCIAV
jgi:hypothetical protein